MLIITIGEWRNVGDQLWRLKCPLPKTCLTIVTRIIMHMEYINSYFLYSGKVLKVRTVGKDKKELLEYF